MWWASVRTRSSLGRRHLAVATVLRSAALVFVVLALLRPVWTAPVTQVSVVYALDVSRSVASGFVQSALQFAQRANREAKPEAVRYVVFAERAADRHARGGRRPSRGERCAAGRSHAPALSGRHQPRAGARPVAARARPGPGEAPGAVHRRQPDRRRRLAGAAAPGGAGRARVSFRRHAADADRRLDRSDGRCPTTCGATSRSPSPCACSASSKRRRGCV